MGLTLSVLGSGSKGNAALIASSSTRVLVDVGFSHRQLRERLAAVGVRPADLSAVVVTHSHSDHICQSALKMCRKERLTIYCHSHHLPVFLTIPGFRPLNDEGLVRLFEETEFTVGDLALRGFELPHDAPGCNVGLNVLYSDSGRQHKLTIATDLGHLPAAKLSHFVDSDLIMLESNHDLTMLRDSDRPESLKARIRGDNGHLSNAQAAEAIVAIAARSRPGALKQVVLAHLSQECNDADLALRTMRGMLSLYGFPVVAIGLTHQDRPAVFELAAESGVRC
ncbi:MAG: MBL fold metallo-hydrolase [Planctomycetes bacterium]|nr:MBL fold metallo-hydrolase [Planctomycetota bacterium]